MKLTTHNPPSIYPPSGDYAHALEVTDPKRFLFVAGTMGLDPASAPGKTLDEQLALIWTNLKAILASADMTVDNIVRLTSYLRDPSYAEANAAARVRGLGGRVIPTTAIVVQTLETDWLVEIEIIAAA
jgi:enamine deaminase RidA (YjgF/YER057c/UK114 family)